MEDEVLAMHGSKDLTPRQKRLHAFFSLCRKNGLSYDAAYELYTFARSCVMEEIP